MRKSECFGSRTSREIPRCWDVRSRRHAKGWTRSRWADPDPEHAGEQLRALYESTELRRRLGERAREDVERHLSDEAVAKVLRQRFDGILRRVRDAGGYPPTPT